MTFTLASAPSIELSVMVIEEPPSPVILESLSNTTSQAEPLPPPAVMIVII